MRVLLGDARAVLIMREDEVESMVRALERAAHYIPLNMSALNRADAATWNIARIKLEEALYDHRDKW